MGFTVSTVVLMEGHAVVKQDGMVNIVMYRVVKGRGESTAKNNVIV